MKFKSIVLAILAGSALLLSCQQEKPVYGISADKDALEFTAEGGQAAVQVTTGQAWTVNIPADAQEWLVANPASGTGDATISFTAAPNNGKDRKTGVKINAGMAGYVAVSITQSGSVAAGDGKTAQTAWSASEANAWINANMESGQVSTENYYIKGKIHKVQTTFADSGNYGNAVFFISDDGQASSNDFEAFQVYYLGGRKWKTGDDDVKVGDEVIIYGPVTLYNTTAETVGKGAAYIYSLNGKSVEAQTEITAATVADFIKTDGATYYRLTGKVSAFKTGTNSSGKNYMQFNLTDETGTILVYGFKEGEYDKWSSKIKDGGKVVLTGTYEFYEKNSTHEVMNATIESFEEGQAQTEITAATVAEFIKTDGFTYYRLTGVVSGFKTGTNSSGKNYMQFNLTDETGTILVYGFKDGEYDKWAATIKDYGTVVLTGTYEFYSAKSQHEVMNTTIESFVEGEAPTTFDQLTVADFIAKADATKPYRLAGKVEDYVITNQDKGYMTFNLVDETGSILVYSLAEGQFAEWGAKLVDGGNIVLVGTYKSYNNTPEVVDATIESFEADPNYKYCKVDKKEISVAATATEAEFKITANAAWTVTLTSTQDNVAIIPASGDADATVKVTFPANTSTEAAVVYTFKLSCDTASVGETLTVTQAQAESANATKVEVDFTAEIADLPQGSSNKLKDGTYTLGGQTFVMHAADGFYQAKSSDAFYLLIGKKDSYIQLPVIDGKALKKVKFLTGAGASENVIIDIAKNDGTLLNINTEKNKKGTEYEYTVAGEVGATYRIAVTNAYNAQFQNLVLSYE